MAQVAKRMTLKELMDEEYARKLQDEENMRFQQQLERGEHTNNNNSGTQQQQQQQQQQHDVYEDFEVINETDEEQEDADEFMEECFYDEKPILLHINESDNTDAEGGDGGGGVEEEATNHPDETKNDEELARLIAEEEDYMAALRLQQEMENESYAYSVMKKQIDNGSSNVGVYGVDDFYGVPKTVRRTDYADADDEHEEDNINPIKLYQSKKKMSMKSTTKHDATAAAKYNAQNLNKFMDSTLHEKNIRLPTRVYNELKSHSKTVEATRIRFKSREDHATYEQALDSRTRLLIYKMLNSEILEEVNGVVSTGKEANVYHAIGNDLRPTEEEERAYEESRAGERERATAGVIDHNINMRRSLVGGEYALKVYKTTLNEFKNRQEYAGSEFRFRNDKFSHQNPRKIIKLWAQKEMRNLRRITLAGLPCPFPVLLRDHILIMKFITNGTAPAPQLRNVNATSSQFQTMYHQVIKLMRRLYQEVNLVHADLSPYNILYANGEPYLIDVSQAVDVEHDNSLIFLRRDCENMSNFFNSKGVPFVMTTLQLFEFVCDKQIKDVDVHIKTIERNNELNPNPTNEEQIQAGVFRHSFIPHNLKEIKSPEKDFYSQKYETRPDIFHMAVTGLKIPPERPEEVLEEDPYTTTDDEE